MEMMASAVSEEPSPDIHHVGSPEDMRGRLEGKETAFHKAGIVCAKTLRLEGKESQCTKSREKWEFDGSG